MRHDSNASQVPIAELNTVCDGLNWNIGGVQQGASARQPGKHQGTCVNLILNVEWTSRSLSTFNGAPH